MQFLRGDLSGRKSHIRPPWSGPEITFTNTCNACGDCITKCPTQIIEKGRGGHPIINFANNECTFCGDCADVCKTGALKKIENKPAWSVVATINNDACLAFKNVECRSCYDPCEAGSINMTPRLGGVSIPLLSATSCIGCGACFSICPTKAITMNNKH